MSRRIAPLLVLLSGFLGCKAKQEETKPGSMVHPDGPTQIAATVFRKPAALRIVLGSGGLREGAESLFVTCGASERVRAEEALIKPEIARAADRRVVLPDTGCLIWVVLKTEPRIGVSILLDSLELRSDTALVYARVNDAGPLGNFMSRPGIALWSPRRLAVVRLISRRTNDPDAWDGDGFITKVP